MAKSNDITEGINLMAHTIVIAAFMSTSGFQSGSLHEIESTLVEHRMERLGDGIYRYWN